MNAPEKGLVTNPACKMALKSLSQLVFGGDGAELGDPTLAKVHDAHSTADVIAPTSFKRDDATWAKYSCGCEVRMVV